MKNCLWVGERLSLFDAARFDHDDDILRPWRIATTDGHCKLEFSLLGKCSGRIDVGVLMLDDHQPYGTFRGEAVGDEGVWHEIRDYFGVTKTHRARV